MSSRKPTFSSHGPESGFPNLSTPSSFLLGAAQPVLVWCLAPEHRTPPAGPLLRQQLLCQQLPCMPPLLSTLIRSAYLQRLAFPAGSVPVPSGLISPEPAEQCSSVWSSPLEPCARSPQATGMPATGVGVDSNGDLVSWFNRKCLPWAHAFNICTSGDGMIWEGF